VTTTSRYTLGKFYSIIIDTRALKLSTIGWGQYLAYKYTIDTTTLINDSTVGVVYVQFSISFTLFIGLLTVKSLVGIVDFYVVKADTLFLLSLADIDFLQIYYNNLKNTVVILTTTIPVIC